MKQTTAASVWLSAAIGVGCGGALYSISVYSTVLVLLVLRFGPKMYTPHDTEDGDEEDEHHEEINVEKLNDDPEPLAQPEEPESIRYFKQSMGQSVRQSSRNRSTRDIPTFGS